jgi:hypothetical protein
MPDVTWFKPPTDDHPGTLNACYSALDIHVIRGRADDVALSLDGTDHTFARLLTEVAACAGVLRALGLGVGDRVVLGALPAAEGVVAALAAARVGAVAAYDDSVEVDAAVRVGNAEGTPGFTVDGEELPRDVAMRAGRTDPAPCADVPGDAVMARHRDDVLTVLAAVGGAEEAPAAPEGAVLVEVGGVRLWSFARG